MADNTLLKNNNPTNQFKNINLDVLKNLKKAKTDYGIATTDEQRNTASAEGDRIRREAGIEAGSQGLLDLPQLNNLISKREAERPKQIDLQQGIVDRQKNLAVQGFKDQFNKFMGTANQEKQQLDPIFRDATSQVRTEDTMQRAGQAKMQATQGLSGAGSATQTDIAQNVITGGQLSGLRQQRAEMEANINRRINEAQSLMNQGIATAESEAEIAKMQNEYADLVRQEQEAEKVESAEREQFLSTIGRFSQDYQAEINRIQNDGDTSNDWQIPYLQDARQNKIRGIEAGQAEADAVQGEREFELLKDRLATQDKAELAQFENQLLQENKVLDAEIKAIQDEQKFTQDSALKTQLFEQEKVLVDQKANNTLQLQAVKDANAMARQNAGDLANLNEIAFRDSLKDVMKSTKGGLAIDVIDKSLENAIGRLPNAQLDRLKKDFYNAEDEDEAGLIADKIKMLEAEDPNANMVKLKIMDTIANNDSWFEGAGGEQKLMSVLATYGIDPEEMRTYMKDSPNLTHNPFGGF